MQERKRAGKERRRNKERKSRIRGKWRRLGEMRNMYKVDTNEAWLNSKVQFGTNA